MVISLGEAHATAASLGGDVAAPPRSGGGVGGRLLAA
jgi:hypothetical protein